MNNIIKIIKGIPGIGNVNIKIKEPKSKAKDFYGFNQR